MTIWELLSSMWELFIEHWEVFILEGVKNTLILSIITIGFGAVLGSFFALAKMSKIAPLKWLVNIIVEVVRGTPLLAQLYVGYFLLPQIIPILNNLSDFNLVSVVLILNSGAYVCEIIRSGIEAVDKGQTEASRSLGLGAGTTMTSIILPQAVKNILPALGNEFITIIKETSLASTFFVGELMTTYKTLAGMTYNALPIYGIIAIIYFILTYILSNILKFAERKMKHNV